MLEATGPRYRNEILRFIAPVVLILVDEFSTGEPAGNGGTASRSKARRTQSMANKLPMYFLINVLRSTSGNHDQL